MNELLEQFTIKDGNTRSTYAETVSNALVSAQIKALREARGFSQEQLADLMGTRQSGISRLERADYSAWKIETLRKLARAFGVRLQISFEEFGTLFEDLGVAGFGKKKLAPRKFEDDPVFSPTKDHEPKKAMTATERNLLELTGGHPPPDLVEHLRQHEEGRKRIGPLECRIEIKLGTWSSLQSAAGLLNPPPEYFRRALEAGSRQVEAYLNSSGLPAGTLARLASYGSSAKTLTDWYDEHVKWFAQEQAPDQARKQVIKPPMEKAA